MSAAENRLTKLFKGLDATERAVMRLRWFKEDAEEPVELLQTTPWEQYDEINRLSRIGDATHHEVSWYGTWLRARLDATTARLGIVSTMQLWSLHADRVLSRLVCDAGEPITQSEYDGRLAAARKELVPVSVLAKLLTEADLEREELDDRQYDRRLREHERELRQMVADGTLPGIGRGRKLQIPAGAFYDWRGEATPVLSEWGLGLEVFPNEAMEQVQRLRAQREAIHALLERAPCLFPLDAEEGEDGSGIDALGRDLVKLVAGGVSAAWSELLALEQIVSEAADRFDGEEPLHPMARRLLEDAKAAATDLREGLKPWFGELVLPDEPDQQVLSVLTRVIEQEAGLS